MNLKEAMRSSSAPLPVETLAVVEIKKIAEAVYGNNGRQEEEVPAAERWQGYIFFPKFYFLPIPGPYFLPDVLHKIGTFWKLDFIKHVEGEKDILLLF